MKTTMIDCHHQVVPSPIYKGATKANVQEVNESIAAQRLANHWTGSPIGNDEASERSRIWAKRERQGVTRTRHWQSMSRTSQAKASFLVLAALTEERQDCSGTTTGRWLRPRYVPPSNLMRTEKGWEMLGACPADSSCTHCL